MANVTTFAADVTHRVAAARTEDAVKVYGKGQTEVLSLIHI